MKPCSSATWLATSDPPSMCTAHSSRYTSVHAENTQTNNPIHICGTTPMVKYYQIIAPPDPARCSTPNYTLWFWHLWFDSWEEILEWADGKCCVARSLHATYMNLCSYLVHLNLYYNSKYETHLYPTWYPCRMRKYSSSCQILAVITFDLNLQRHCRRTAGLEVETVAK